MRNSPTLPPITPSVVIHLYAFGVPKRQVDEGFDASSVQGGAPGARVIFEGHYPERPVAPQGKQFLQHTQAPIHGRPVHQMRACSAPPDALEKLTALHHALSSSFRQLGDLMTQTDLEDRRNTAIDVASAVMQVMGHQLPELDLSKKSHEFGAHQHRMVIGEQLVRTLTMPELVQALLYGTGRLHAGHAEATAELVLRSLFQSELLDEDQARHLLSHPHRTPIVYSAIAAWMFDKNMRPDPRSFLGPDAGCFNDDVNIVLKALDTAVP